MTDLDLLLQNGQPTSVTFRDADERALCDLHAAPPPRPGRSTLVRANMVSTIDGAAWGATGRSGSINNPADLRVFHVLRALADVVLVGAGTARTEQYVPLTVPKHLAQERRAAGLTYPLQTAVVTRSGVLPPALTAAGATEATAPLPIVLTTTQGAKRLQGIHPADHLIVAGTDEVNLSTTLDALADRGLTTILTEGGPTLLGSLLETGLVDELFLTTSPRVIGGQATRVVHTGRYLTSGDSPAHLGHLLHSNGVLLARWILPGTGTACD